MKSKMFIVLIASFSVFISGGQADPPCHANEIWRCNDIAVEWFHTLPQRSIAVTKSEVEVMCQAWKKTFDCFSGWGKRCMSPMQREVATLMFEGSVDVQHALCTPGVDTYEKYLKHAPCLNEVSHMDEFRSQLEYIVAVFHKSHSIPVQDMLTYGCCAVKKNCNSILKLVREHCNDEAAEVVEEVKIMMLGLLTEAMCEDLNGTEKKCKDLLPPEGEKITSSVVEKSPFLKTLTHILKNWLDS